MTSPAAAPAVPVAVNVTGEPDKEPDVAVNVFDPAVVPNVHAGDVAIPELFVVTDPEVAKEPPPEATAKTTDTPCTAFPAESVTSTDGEVDTAVPATADCPLPAFTAMVMAAPAVPVAVKVIGEPDREPDVAVNVFDPAVVPNVHAGDVAIPELFVVTDPDDASEPPPEVTAKVTAVPAMAFPKASVTITLGNVVTAVPTVAL